MGMINEKLEILFFYSTSKYESVATKLVLKDYLISSSIYKRFVLREIEFDRNNDLCKKYSIKGVPTTLVLYNNKLRVRHLGEFTAKELNVLLENALVKL